MRKPLVSINTDGVDAVVCLQESTGLHFGVQPKYLGVPDKNCQMRGDEILLGFVLARPLNAARSHHS